MRNRVNLLILLPLKISQVPEISVKFPCRSSVGHGNSRGSPRRSRTVLLATRTAGPFSKRRTDRVSENRAEFSGCLVEEVLLQPSRSD